MSCKINSIAKHVLKKRMTSKPMKYATISFLQSYNKIDQFHIEVNIIIRHWGP